MVAVILLSGASSAGKTSVVVELTRLLGPDRTTVTGFDAVLARVRSRHLLVLRRTKLLVAAHKQAVRAASPGRHVVIDTTLMTRGALEDAGLRLRGQLGALFVGVKPPLEVSERWESLRGDRPAGHARRHYQLVHYDLAPQYDLVLDTSRMTPAEAAQRVMRRLTDAPTG